MTVERVQYLASGYVRSRCLVTVEENNTWRQIPSEAGHDWRIGSALWIGEVGEPISYRATYRCLVCGTEVDEQGPIDVHDPQVPERPLRHLNWNDPIPEDSK